MTNVTNNDVLSICEEIIDAAVHDGKVSANMNFEVFESLEDYGRVGHVDPQYVDFWGFDSIPLEHDLPTGHYELPEPIVFVDTIDEFDFRFFITSFEIVQNNGFKTIVPDGKWQLI